MKLSTALECIASFPKPESVEQFAQDLPREWIEEALAATGTATLRRRRLPAEQVPWLVIGMALLRDRPITDVVNKLDLVMPSPTGSTVAPSALVQARGRLGETPMAWLFARTADTWTHECAGEDRWRGLALYGVDGTTIRVPDSDENRDHFGLASGPRGDSGYPLVRLAGLMALRSHLLAAASFGPYGQGEHTYAEDLWPCVPDNSLVIADRNFWAANILVPLMRDGENRHWLIRAKTSAKWLRVVERFSPTDELVEFEVSSWARRRDSSLPKTWRVRVIQYQRKGFRPEQLLTSLLDPTEYPAREIVQLYHERWELELGYREIKTEMLEGIPLRSKSVDRVRQELWGVLIAYNLVRLEMTRIADEAAVPPTRISFVGVFQMICDEWIWCSIASPGAVPRHLKNLRQKVKQFILPPRRSDRSYPRAVKVKMSNYAKKQRPAEGPERTGLDRGGFESMV